MPVLEGALALFAVVARELFVWAVVIQKVRVVAAGGFFVVFAGTRTGRGVGGEEYELAWVGRPSSRRADVWVSGAFRKSTQSKHLITKLY